MSNKKGVVLACGDSIKEYAQENFEDAYVIGVNDAWHVHKELNGKAPRLDLVMVQDPAHHGMAKKPWILNETPKDIPLRFINASWEKYAKPRGNYEIVRSDIHASSYEKFALAKKMGIRLHGNTSVVAAILTLMLDGIYDVYVYGHDCSPEYVRSKSFTEKAFKELNFLQTIAEKHGGSVYLAESSWLWNYKHPEGKELAVKKAEVQVKAKPKRSRKKKVEDIQD